MNWVKRGFCGLSALSLLISSLSGVSFRSSAAEPDHRSLAGRWRFELDRTDSGIEQRWFSRNLNGALNLPGSLPEQGIGDPVSIATQWTGEIVDKSWFTAPQYARYREPGNVKIPFWLQPDTYYSGVAWYQREIEIPVGWATRRVVLSLERPHWETRVWIDDRFVGTNDSLSTAHEYDLGASLTPGRHRLTIRVDNRLVVDVGVNSHSISDHTQGNWNGLVGNLELRTTPLVWLEEVRLFPADTNGEFRVTARIGNATGTAGSGTLSVRYEARLRGNASGRVLVEQAAQWSETGGVVECRCKLPADGVGAWDEFRPTLHPLLVQLSTGDAKSIRYGSRQISTSGTQFLMNGQKTFIRGTLECCIFPNTGHPPTDLDSWRRIIRIAKAYGLNLIRFHSWCPP
ncbi:MAG TPA: glycoside hydrolase, partial [Candidatus Dormibacteraeota bacterium]|nr:glycoside hydrolase [Candidatus Dormibacteraeota bacterium]